MADRQRLSNKIRRVAQIDIRGLVIMRLQGSYEANKHVFAEENM